MADSWKCLFDGTIEERPVKIERYDEGGYRVHTTQGADDPGTFESDSSSTLIMTPTEKGRPITIDEDSPEEFREALISEGFSETAVNEIVDKMKT